MLHKALTSFITEVWWDDPDYLLVDLPPGTGDVARLGRGSCRPRRS